MSCFRHWLAGTARLSIGHSSGEPNTEARYYFTAGYALCAVIAFAASRMRGSAAARMGPFWLRIAVLCAVFAVLRSFDANVLVSGAFKNLSHAVGERPGPFLMVAAVIAFGAAVAGLMIFRGRSLHPAVRGAAIAIVLIILLAVAQSVSLYLPVVILQQMVGPLTVSRIIEALLLIALASSALFFIRDARGAEKG